MPLNFPSSPTSGQTYVLNGVSYIYNTTLGAWTTTSVTNSFGDISGVANAAFGVANGAFGLANGVSTNAAAAFGFANASFNVANASYNNSNAAFLKANNAFPNTSATLVGNMVITGNVVVNSNNTTSGGILLSDDGDIADMNDGYCSMRFSSGVRVYSGNKSGTPAITLGSDGNMTLTGSTLNLGTSSIGSNGYTRLPNGLLLQWGTSGTINQDSSGSVTFPIAFAATPYCIQITARGAKNDTSGGLDSISAQSTTSFTIAHGADGNVTFYWMAIGI